MQSSHVMSADLCRVQKVCYVVIGALSRTAVCHGVVRCIPQQGASLVGVRDVLCGSGDRADALDEEGGLEVGVL